LRNSVRFLELLPSGRSKCLRTEIRLEKKLKRQTFRILAIGLFKVNMKKPPNSIPPLGFAKISDAP